MEVAENPHDSFACKTVKMFFYMEVKKHVPVNPGYFMLILYTQLASRVCSFTVHITNISRHYLVFMTHIC
jgi:hypothetical protein